jgi:hypothetical protein
MVPHRKVVLHSLGGITPALEPLIEQFMAEGVIYVGVVGVDASRVEDVVDEICAGDGTREPYEMLTAFHDDESVQDAVALAESLLGEFAGPVRVVAL